MSYAEHQNPTGRRGAGLAIAVVLHVVVIYALVTGLARKAVEVIRGPIETKLIEELKKMPPPDKPPPPPPKVDPPPYVPPPEIAVAAPAVAAPVITVTIAPPPPPPAPPPPPPPPAPPPPPPAPPPPPPAPPPPPPPPPKPMLRVAPVLDAARNCRKPEYPAASKRLEQEGTVVLRILIDEGGKVVESRIETSSGHTRLDEAARAALSQCQFKPGTVDGTPEKAWANLSYVWRME